MPEDKHPLRHRQLLDASIRGDEPSTRELASLAYEDLRRQAQRMLGPSTGSIEATALVHDAFVRLIGQRKQDWRSRSHFAAISSTMLRRVLIDLLRARGRQRDRQTQLSTMADLPGHDSDGVDVLDLDDALREFSELDPQGARIVEMRFFGGLTVREIADELQLARSTVSDSWAFARAWLGRRLEDGK